MKFILLLSLMLFLPISAKANLRCQTFENFLNIAKDNGKNETETIIVFEGLEAKKFALKLGSGQSVNVGRIFVVDIKNDNDEKMIIAAYAYNGCSIKYVEMPKKDAERIREIYRKVQNETK